MPDEAPAGAIHANDTVESELELELPFPSEATKKADTVLLPNLHIEESETFTLA